MGKSDWASGCVEAETKTIPSPMSCERWVGLRSLRRLSVVVRERRETCEMDVTDAKPGWSALGHELERARVTDHVPARPIPEAAACTRPSNTRSGLVAANCRQPFPAKTW